MTDVVARIAEAAEAYFGTVRRDGYIVDGVDADELAGVVAEALGLTEETAFKYTHLVSGKFTIIENSSADVRIARRIAGDTHELAEVVRWVSPWVSPEGQE